MQKLDVICPETMTKEKIGCITDRDGEVLVVLRCTRCDPRADVRCAEGCRTQLDPRFTAPR